MFRTNAINLRLSGAARYISQPLGAVRAVRYQAYDSGFDQDELAEARKWHVSFDEKALPKGQTTYSRSSGPGGQHVNKTESKATTVWSIEELSKSLPKLMRLALRTSRYYAKGNDSITIQAQTQRSRSANHEENHKKLVEELQKMYKQHVPQATSSEKVKKHEDL
ncbi:peptidyl-tRNA hydrolase domain-containing protein [Hypoxylon sp. FL1284]|nr:peptidyl-tRNA hydrolase domain-containing protein [Hypoxylon sp. FL1284]